MTILGGLELNDRTTGERKPLVVKTDRQLTAMLEVYHRENQTVGQEEVERARGKVFEILGYAETTSKKEKEVGDFLDTVLAGGDGDVMSGTTMPAKTRDEESTVAAGDKPLMDRFHRADAVEKRPSSAMPMTSLEAEEEREKRELEQIKLDREKAFVDVCRVLEKLSDGLLVHGIYEPLYPSLDLAPAELGKP